MTRITALRLLYRQRPLHMRKAITQAAQLLGISIDEVEAWPSGELPRETCDLVLGGLCRLEAQGMIERGEQLPPLHTDAVALNHPDDRATPTTTTLESAWHNVNSAANDPAAA